MNKAKEILDGFTESFPQIKSFMAKRKKILERKKEHKPYPENKLCDSTKPYSYGETWTTLDGQRIPLVNLRDSHLENIIFYVKKRKVSNGFLIYLLAEKKRRKKIKLMKTKAGKLLYDSKR